MPKYNIDEMKQLAEPIEIVLEGKTYIVSKINTDMLKKADAAGENKDIDTPIKQLAIFVGVDPNELKDIDLRKIGKAISYITDSIGKDIDQIKNASGAEAKS
jgi:hypothetical protein